MDIGEHESDTTPTGGISICESQWCPAAPCGVGYLLRLEGGESTLSSAVKS